MASNRPRILLTYPVTARTYWFGEHCLDAMREVGDVVLNPADHVLPPKELAELGRGCSVIVLDRLTPVTAELLSLMPDLVAVVRGGVDHRHLDVKAASAAGVLATQVNAGYRAAVAELVLGLMLTRPVRSAISRPNMGRARAAGAARPAGRGYRPSASSATGGSRSIWRAS